MSQRQEEHTGRLVGKSAEGRGGSEGEEDSDLAALARAAKVDGRSAERGVIEREAYHLQLREKHVQLGQLGLARAAQVARRNVDDLMRIGEIGGAHVVHYRNRRLKSAEENPEKSLRCASDTVLSVAGGEPIADPRLAEEVSGVSGIRLDLSTQLRHQRPQMFGPLDRICAPDGF